ncbi:MAG: HNH endonuclease [Campylobacterota bacterium]|nr:HNH endonuclease [Campylobacterota bacterium]
MKICKKCKITKELSEFPKEPRNSDGLKGSCRICIANQKREYNLLHKEKIANEQKEYRLKNKESIKAQKKEYYDNNKCVISKRHKEYRDNNKEKIAKSKKIYENKNKEKIAKQRKQYSINNKEKITIYKKEYQKKNKEILAVEKKAYYEKNKEVFKAKSRIYSKTEKGRITDTNSKNKRRFIKRITKDGTIPVNVKYPLTIELQELLDEQNNKCYYCECELEEKHLDHYIPLSKGGSHSILNVVWSCPTCNMSKGSKMPDEFIKRV